MCLVVDDKCEMNASVSWNISFVRGVLFYVGIFACICKIVFIRYPIRVFCSLFAYFVYITKIIFWNHIERLCLAHLQVLAWIFPYTPHSMP